VSFTGHYYKVSELEGSIYQTFMEPNFWLFIVIAVTIALLPQFIWNRFQRAFYPHDYQRLQLISQIERKKRTYPLTNKLSESNKQRHSVWMSRVDLNTRDSHSAREVDRGFAFSETKGQADWLTKAVSSRKFEERV